jgi:hypothetical protein
MIGLYYWPTPNGNKITMFLEEAGLDFRIHPVDIGAGDQFKQKTIQSGCGATGCSIASAAWRASRRPMTFD